MDRSEEHKQSLMDRLRASSTLMRPEGVELTDWVDSMMIRGKSFQDIELFVGEVQRIVCDERVNRQIESNLRQQFGGRLDQFDYLTLLKEHRHFSTSDMFGDNNERFLEWLGVEDPA